MTSETVATGRLFTGWIGAGETNEAEIPSGYGDVDRSRRDGIGVKLWTIVGLWPEKARGYYGTAYNGGPQYGNGDQYGDGPGYSYARQAPPSRCCWR